MAHEGRSTTLRRGLRANAAFSIASGLAALFMGPAVAGLLGFESPIGVYVVGAGLLAFAADLLLQARARIIAPLRAVTSTVGDVAWVLATAVWLAGWPTPLSAPAMALLGVIAVLVAGFAVWQLEGLRRLVRNPTPGPRTMLEFSRDVAAAPARVWSAVADLDGYHRVAPNLSASRVVRGRGEGLVRECADHQGGRWTETCSHWDDGREYRFVVHTEAADYPYPFRALQGLWRVEPHGAGSRITMRFEATFGGGYLGDLMMALGAPKFAAVAEALLDNWQHAVEDRPRPVAA